MKITVITGSPRKKGNSFAMTDAFIRAARELGHSVERFDAAFLQIDVDAPRTGVQRVLHQLLDHGSRPFDDFAGGDLVDEGVGKLADRHVLATLARRLGNQP